MSKGLEALIDLSQQNKISLTEEHRIECYKTIEKELKALEIIKGNNYLRNFILNWAYEYDEINNTSLYETLKEVLL